MKIRMGFISNSSSSSFIVVFDKRPKTKKELKELLFGDRKEYHDPYSSEYWPTDDVVDIVWNDLKGQRSMTMEKIAKEIDAGWFDDRPEFPDLDIEDREKYDAGWKKYENDSLKAAMRRAEVYFGHAVKEGKLIVNFHYSDNDSKLSCAMEHGDLFEKLEHDTVSHH